MLGGKDNFRNAIIVGRKDLGSVIEAEDFEIGIIYLASGVAYPPHAHEAIELYHSILGTALWGSYPLVELSYFSGGICGILCVEKII